ncbi:MAG: chemotaxis protein CheB [Bacteroidales bacterium]|nr:chemotaxis protein CheB [Bacteroidales bacterium]
MPYQAIVIGSSAGGLHALKIIISGFSASFDTPIIVTQHLSPNSDNYLVQFLNQFTQLTVKEADEKEVILRGYVYIAPPNFHLLVEEDFTLSLNVEEKVNFARPSIDVLFETAAEAYKNQLIGIILTGANHDGAKGIARIKQKGGYTIAQSPDTAEAAAMPQAAINTGFVDQILKLEDIPVFLNKICKSKV